MNVEEQIIDEFSKQMSDAIDWQILAGMLVEMGWTQVELPRYVDNYHAIDIREWVREFCMGKTDSCGGVWIFENPADATMFTLRWT